ncbi:MAG: hypothetical protein ACOH5I_03510 [Oligoflexus sp.]
MDNKDTFQAARILVDFIRDFTSLTEQQLLAIRSLMEETVQDVMQSVNSMSSKADEKKSQASEVLVRDEKTSEFRYSATKIKEEDDELTKAETDERRREFLENKLRRAGGVFSKHMEAMHTLDLELQNLLFRVMGAASMDDVMGQRLTHVVSSLYLLKEGISEVIQNYDTYLRVKEIKFLRNRILTEVYRSYTTEDEKVIFHKIFGQPKEVKQAS